jgi:hypothetical protein
VAYAGIVAQDSKPAMARGGVLKQALHRFLLPLSILAPPGVVPCGMSQSKAAPDKKHLLSKGTPTLRIQRIPSKTSRRSIDRLHLPSSRLLTVKAKAQYIPTAHW